MPSTLVLGRKPAPQRLQDMVLTVPDHTGTVSRSHARIEITEDGLWITDLGSTNGTRVIDAEGKENVLRPGRRFEVLGKSRIFLGDVECSIIMSIHGRARL
ncbi:FHA domain-containing protein [Bifidobacterium ruminantium]|uniref:FHA domain-containing protein n=1 Tax=Bifidobacterium ruminantium TaxID=78346 RepID=UPI0030B8070D